MATPRGSEHRDLEQRIRNMEQQLQQLATLALRREQLKVDEGDFAVTGGGDITVTDGGGVTVSGSGGVSVTDGGDVTVDGDGHLTWLDPNARERFRIGLQPGQEAGGSAVRMVYFTPNGSQRVVVGEILAEATGNTLGHGLLVEDDTGNDALAVLAGPDAGQLYLDYAADDYLWLKNAAGVERFYVDASSLNYRGPAYFEHANGDSNLTVDWNGLNTLLYGGTTSNGAQLREMILFNGNDAQKRTIRFRDGADSTHIPIEASSFDVVSSGEVKDVQGNAEPGALSKVRGTPIRRWRYRNGGKSRPLEGEVLADVAEDTPLTQIGPLAEEVPAELSDNLDDPDPANRTVSINRGLWLLWQAVQELAESNEDLQRQVADLKGAQ